MIRPSTVILVGILLFGPLLVVELGTRVLIDRGRLPEAPSSNLLTDVSLANMLRRGKPDVLIVGASTLRNAVRPYVLKKLIAEKTGQTVHIQSIAQDGISLDAQRLLVQELARRDLLPDVVITGISPAVVSGEFGESEWFLGSELGRLWSGCEGDLQATDALDCRLGQVSALWRWRGRLDRLSEALESGIPGTLTDDSRTLRPSGWLDTTPTTRGRLQGAVPRALEQFDAAISMSDDVRDDFAALADELRSHGVTVVAIEMPYVPELEDALKERHPEWEEERDAAYAELQAAAGFEIVDVEGFGDWTRTRSFHDLRHLSGEGAAPFTRQLWRMPAFREPLLEGLGLAAP